MKDIGGNLTCLEMGQMVLDNGKLPLKKVFRLTTYKSCTVKQTSKKHSLKLSFPSFVPLFAPALPWQRLNVSFKEILV